MCDRRAVARCSVHDQPRCRHLRRGIHAIDTPRSGLPPFDEVYQANADAVYRFCVSQVADATDAEDLAADVFAAAFAAYERTQPEPDGLRPWLFRIARNAAIDRGRRQQVHGRWLRRLRPSEPADVEAAVQLREDLRSVISAAHRLRRRERLVIGMRVAGGLSFAEIGRAMGMRENAARMATQRALERLREALDEQA